MTTEAGLALVLVRAYTRLFPISSDVKGRQMWFDLDHVDLSPGRRDYLQYKFGTVKILNGRNGMFLPWFIQMCALSPPRSRFV